MKVLFVDDEERVLDGIRRMLFSADVEWDACFARGAEEALRMMETGGVDILVTDMRMPGMGGIALLEEAAARHPAIARIVLSGESEDNDRARLRTAAVAHQCLAKPCSPDVLRAAIARTVAVREVVSSVACREAVGRIARLPAAPRVFARITEAMQDPNVSIADISRLVSQEPLVTAKLLQLVNSSFFSRAAKVVDVDTAVKRLGLGNVRTVVLCSELFGAPRGALSAGDHDRLQREALTASRLASRIARGRPSAEHAGTAALLANVGTLVLAAAASASWAQFAAARASAVPLLDAERRAFGATHAEVGAYFLAQWGLPDVVVEAVAMHHSPGMASAMGFGLAGAVHVASALAAREEVDEFYLQALGVADELAGWRAFLAEEGGD